MAYSCVNKHGRFAQRQSFGRNVALNFRNCRRHVHSPGSSRPRQRFGANLFRVIPVSLNWMGRVKWVGMSQKWKRQVAEPAAYQHLTKAISDSSNSHEGAVWFPPGEPRQEREGSCWKAIKERSIGSAAFWSSAEQSPLLLQHWRWGCSSPGCSPDLKRWDSWSSSWALELLLFLL